MNEVEFVTIDQQSKQMPSSPGNMNPGERKLYSIFVKNFSDQDSVWEQIQKEGELKPHTLNGFTWVLFFKTERNTPPVTEFNNGIELDEKYFPYCVAAYWHYPSGEKLFKKYPF